MYTNDKIYTTSRMTGGLKRFKMIYDGLVKKGYDVTLYCGEEADDLKKYNNKAISVNRNEKKSFLFPSIIIFFRNRKILKQIRKEKYTDVIVFDVPTAVGLCINRIKNINLFLRQDLVEYRKIILSNQNKNRIYTWLYLKFMSLCEYICCNKAKKIIVQCNYDLINLLSRHRLSRKKIENKSYVLINNVNTPWIISKSKQELTTKINNNNSFSICFIGDFSNTRKGHDIFLSAVEKLVEDKCDIEAYVIGDGILLENEKSNYCSSDYIHFMGRLDNPINVIRQVDLVVVPSRADSCPNTVLEALYNGILVIGSNAGGIPEILTDKDMLFELNTESLYMKIKEIYNNKEICKNLLKKEGIRNKELSFDWIQKIIDIMGV